jgi:hypothetical protein
MFQSSLVRVKKKHEWQSSSVTIISGRGEMMAATCSGGDYNRADRGKNSKHVKRNPTAYLALAEDKVLRTQRLWSDSQQSIHYGKVAIVGKRAVIQGDGTSREHDPAGSMHVPCRPAFVRS